MNILEIKNLKKYYGNSKGVDDVSLYIEKGDVFGFIGPNGAGKSTTIRCILSLIYPTDGEIKVFGMDSVRDKVEISKRIGYLPSEVFYYDNMKVSEILEYNASLYGKVDKDEIRRLANDLELDLNKKVEDLSLGNKKKVGIINAVIHKPDFIILDEPTSGLDPLMQQKFFNILEERRKNGATILFSSHNLDEVKKMCNKIAIIRKGIIEDIDKVKSLSENSYKKVIVSAKDDVFSSLESLDGLEVKNTSQEEKEYLYRGDINLLIEKLSKLKIDNLSIKDPDLEEIFLHYYE